MVEFVSCHPRIHHEQTNNRAILIRAFVSYLWTASTSTSPLTSFGSRRSRVGSIPAIHECLTNKRISTPATFVYSCPIRGRPPPCSPALVGIKRGRICLLPSTNSARIHEYPRQLHSCIRVLFVDGRLPAPSFGGDKSRSNCFLPSTNSSRINEYPRHPHSCIRTLFGDGRLPAHQLWWGQVAVEFISCHPRMPHE